MGRIRLVFSGSGGQGVVTAAIILAEAAVLYDGLTAVQTQSYGAAARGGTTRSDVIISEDPINYPMVVQPNILVCLTQEAYHKYAPMIRPGGLLISDSHYVKTERRVDAVQNELPLYETVTQQLGSAVALNICMLGAVMGFTRLVQVKSIKDVLQKRVPNRFLDMNHQALNLGLELAGETLPRNSFPSP